MSNYALQSRLNQLQSQLHQAERINAELRGELSTLEYGVSRAQNELEQYNENLRGALTNCHGSMTSSHQRVVDAIAVQGEIERLYVRFKQVELANKKIRAANNRKYYDFANYRTVRKIVQGIMDNLDVHMVSDQTITRSVEVQHLQTPDYWLTCVLISVMAWRNDDRPLAGRAMARAIRLDKKSSAVFYMPFNLRMGREEAALKWFYTYQECPLKGSDQRTFLMLFSLVSRTLADQVDESTRGEIFSFIQRVIEANQRAAGYSREDVIRQIRRYFDRMRPSDHLEYAALRTCCVRFDELSAVMMQAKNNICILEFILQTVHVPVEERNAFLKSYIDELIAAPNQAEQEVYDEIAYNELVIRYEGDVERAKKVFDAEQARKASDLDLIAEMIRWIYERDIQGVNGQIRLNMFTLTKFLQEGAVDAHVADYRRRRSTVQPVVIGDYSAEVDFTREDEACAAVTRCYTEQRDAEIAGLKNWPAFLALGIGAAAVVGASFAGFWLLLAALAAAGYSLYTLLSNLSRKKQLEQACAAAIRSTTATLQQLFAEFAQYQAELDGYDSYYERIKNEFGKI